MLRDVRQLFFGEHTAAFGRRRWAARLAPLLLTVHFVLCSLAAFLHTYCHRHGLPTLGGIAAVAVNAPALAAHVSADAPADDGNHAAPPAALADSLSRSDHGCPLCEFAAQPAAVAAPTPLLVAPPVVALPARPKPSGLPYVPSRALSLRSSRAPPAAFSVPVAPAAA